MADKKDIATNRLLNLLRGSAEEESTKKDKESKQASEENQEQQPDSQESVEKSSEESIEETAEDTSPDFEEISDETFESDEVSAEAKAESSEEIEEEETLDSDLFDMDLELSEEESEETPEDESPEEDVSGESQLKEVEDFIFDTEEEDSVKQSDKLGEKSEDDLDLEIEDTAAEEEEPGLDALNYELEIEDLGNEFIGSEDKPNEPEKPSEAEDFPEEEEEEFILESEEERQTQPESPASTEEDIVAEEADSFDLENDADEFSRLTGRKSRPDVEEEIQEEEFEETESEPEITEEISEEEISVPEETEPEEADKTEESEESVDEAEEKTEKPKSGSSKGSFFSSIIPSKRKTVGIDIGSYAIKYLEISDGNPPVLENYKYHVIPQEFRDNAVKRKNYVNEVLGDILDEKVRKNARICVTASTSELSIRNLKMPKVSKKELKEAVMWASKKSLPFDIDEAMLDYAVVGEVKESGIDKLDVLLVATHREEIDLQVAFLESIGITPERLTLNPLAIWSAYRQFSQIHIEGSVMIVELGEQSSYINFVNDQVLRFVREINVAGKDFTDALSGNITTKNGRINIDRTTANAVKTKYGIPAEGESGFTEEGISYQQLSARLREPLERLMQEMQRSLEYYKKEMSYSTVEQIYVTGGGAKLRNLESYLSHHLKASREDGVAVQILDPLDYIEIGSHISNPDELKQVSTALTGPIGLVSSKHPDLNLLPERLKLLPRQRKMKSIAGLTGLVAGLLMIGTSLFLYFQTNILDSQLKSIRQSYEQIAPQEKAYKAAVAKQNQVAGDLQNLRDQIQIETLDARPLKLLSNMVPANFALDQVNVQLAPDRTNITLTVSGNIYGSVTDSEIDLIEFYQRLMNTDYFSQVQLEEKRKLNIANTTGLFFKVSMVIS